ncbi:MAG: YHS domain-containing protein [Syntrophales bacterium LBB04]|nr:YHS domain-containing protein [Syntrophales bacterium LBB04]
MRFIIYMFLFYLAYKFLKGLFGAKEASYQEFPGQPREASNGDDLVEDPYCHTYVPMSDAYKKSLNGKTIYFCSKKCLDEFTSNLKN